MLSAAVLHIPLLASKISTALLQPPPPEHTSVIGSSSSACFQPQPHSPLFNPSTHTQLVHSAKKKSNHRPMPPANIANPWIGSEVAARPSRATLSAAVLHLPLLASKISTALLLSTLPSAQRIKNRQRQLNAQTPFDPNHILLSSTPQNTQLAFKSISANKITTNRCRPRISPILDSAAMLLRNNLEQR